MLQSMSRQPGDTLARYRKLEEHLSVAAGAHREPRKSPWTRLPQLNAVRLSVVGDRSARSVRSERTDPTSRTQKPRSSIRVSRDLERHGDATELPRVQAARMPPWRSIVVAVAFMPRNAAALAAVCRNNPDVVVISDRQGSPVGRPARSPVPSPAITRGAPLSALTMNVLPEFVSSKAITVPSGDHSAPYPSTAPVGESLRTLNPVGVREIELLARSSRTF